MCASSRCQASGRRRGGSQIRYDVARPGGFVSSGGRSMPRIDAATVRRLLRHEAEVHAIPGRTCATWATRCCSTTRSSRSRSGTGSRRSAGRTTRTRSTGGWPRSASLFASIGRQPHVWRRRRTTSRPTSSRGWRRTGSRTSATGLLMVARDVEPARAALRDRPLGRGLDVERLHAAVHGTRGERRRRGDRVGAAGGLRRRTRTGGPASSPRRWRRSPTPRFTHYLVRRDGEPAAVARRATFDGLSLPVLDRDGGLRHAGAGSAGSSPRPRWSSGGGGQRAGPPRRLRRQRAGRRAVRAPRLRDEPASPART